MVSELTDSTGQRSAARVAQLNGLRRHLGEYIKGQAHVLDRICSALTRGELGLSNPRRPVGSFLFVGPTGVGKTELTHCFSAYLFGGKKPICFDMSEYQLQKSVEKLVGENRNDPGLLGRALRNSQRGTLLFDEIEKAHPLVLDLFLQILEEARITLATGEVLNLSEFYVVGTSNIGSSESMRMESAPFASVERTVLMRVREQLRPELVGRFSEIVVFARLDYATQREICETMIAVELMRLRSLGYSVTSSQAALEFLVRSGYHRLLGARPMRATVEREIQDALASLVLLGKGGHGSLGVGRSGNRLAIEAR